jgi:hypothetical protein
LFQPFQLVKTGLDLLQLLWRGPQPAVGADNQAEQLAQQLFALASAAGVLE